VPPPLPTRPIGRALQQLLNCEPFARTLAAPLGEIGFRSGPRPARPTKTAWRRRNGRRQRQHLVVIVVVVTCTRRRWIASAGRPRRSFVKHTIQLFVLVAAADIQRRVCWPTGRPAVSTNAKWPRAPPGQPPTDGARRQTHALTSTSACLHCSAESGQMTAPAASVFRCGVYLSMWGPPPLNGQLITRSTMNSAPPMASGDGATIMALASARQLNHECDNMGRHNVGALLTHYAPVRVRVRGESICAPSGGAARRFSLLS
jgi:hypothetical protein